MKTPALQPPTNPHFFQPLSPGFDSNLKIPIAFFSKYIEGRNELRTIKLRSDVCDQAWEVEMEGRRFTRGWKEFASAHDFRIGDIIIFKHEGDMVFNVTPFGPSCCEIQYTKSHIKDEQEDGDDDNENRHKIRKVSRNNNLRTKTEAKSSLSYEYCFVAKVTSSNLQSNSLNLPKNASSSNALNRGCREILLVNEEGNSWISDLRFRESAGIYYISRGWRRFCKENKQRIGDLIPFNLVGDGESTPLICVCPEEECSELINTYKKQDKKHDKKTTEKRRLWFPSSSSRQNRFVTIYLSAYNIKASKLILPIEFTRINGLTDHKKIVLMDKHGEKLLTNLVRDGPNLGRRGLGQGWKHFCEANEVLGIGKTFVLELIWEDTVPVLKFRHKIKNEPICV